MAACYIEGCTGILKTLVAFKSWWDGPEEVMQLVSWGGGQRLVALGTGLQT